MSASNRAVRCLFSITVLFSIFFALAMGTQLGAVKAEAVRLRSEPNLNSPILALITPDLSTAEPAEGSKGWYAILSRDQESFMSSYYRELENNKMELSDCPLLAYVNTGSSVLNLRSGPGTAYSILEQVPSGELLTVLSEQDGWFEIQQEDASAYICGDYVLLMTEEEFEDYKASADYIGSEIAQYSQDYIGCNYVYGGNGPSSFDCSGFTKYIYSQFGYTLNRTATDQLDNGVTIEKEDVQAGDLVFFRSSGTEKPVSHVGLYIGEGRFIHASTNEYKVRIDHLFTGYYADIYVGARRIV